MLSFSFTSFFCFLVFGRGKEALPILCVRYFGWERERYRQTERRKRRHHCRAKIGDEFTLSLAKNSHKWRWAYTFPCQKFALFVSPFTLPVSLHGDSERSPWWRWNLQWVHTFHCQNFFSLQALFPLSQMARAARRVIENPRHVIKSCPVLFCSSHRKKWIKLIPKTIGNRKRDCAWGGSGDKPHLRKSTDRKAQIRKVFVLADWFVLCDCRFSQVRFITPSHLTHNLFFCFQ